MRFAISHPTNRSIPPVSKCPRSCTSVPSPSRAGKVLCAKRRISRAIEADVAHTKPIECCHNEGNAPPKGCLSFSASLSPRVSKRGIGCQQRRVFRRSISLQRMYQCRQIPIQHSLFQANPCPHRNARCSPKGGLRSKAIGFPPCRDKGAV